MIGVLFFLSLGSVTYYIFSFPEEKYLASSSLPLQNSRSSEVQKVFDNRCVVCHSCNNAPCQVNLTSYTGLRRGATQVKVYEGARQKSVPPTRLDIDGTSEEDWREKSFFPIIDENHPPQGLLARVLLAKDPQNLILPPPVETTPTCSPKTEDPVRAMPYGLPSLSSTESQMLLDWIQRGAPGNAPTPFGLSPEEQRAQQAWEEFLNEPSMERRLVSRYLYEHLFLAHIHFSDSPLQFFRLIRSRNACNKSLSEIATRRPNDNPGETAFFYCFRPVLQTIVEKTHLPYLMDEAKLQWIRQNFYSEPWSVGHLPSYEPAKSANPFLTFEAIPARARYQFLLEDAQYHVATFIKGPVCNGTSAVNAIADQFYVFFMDPSSDLLVRDVQFHTLSKHLLVVPAEKGSDGQLLGLAGYFSKYPPLRNRYRKYRATAMKKSFPQGLSLNDLWAGNNSNPNSVLTVLRHNDNSYVLKGARGDASHTAFVLDYALFERLVYNLVVGFDVYGNITHQLHTRVYMGMIRMEAESNLLEFFPPSYREPIRKEWYSPTPLAAMEKKLIDKKIPNNMPSQVVLDEGLSPRQARAQMYKRILSERIPYMIQRYPDPLNWRSMKLPESVWKKPSLTPSEYLISMLSTPNTVGTNAWAQHLPDTTLLVLKAQGQVDRIYTLVKNKRFKSEGSLLFEENQRLPEEDQIMVLPGLATSYPNYFFVVDTQKISHFVKGLRSAHNQAQWDRFLLQWGLSRRHPQFWQESDKIQGFLKNRMGLEGGVLDYTRYDVWTH